MSPRIGVDPTIAILMATKNGSRFLKEQLDSIQNQTFKNWRLIVSDDGSTDNTLEILNSYQSVWGEEKLEIRQGPMCGFAMNFLSLASDSSIKADFFAFCDQDDVWLPPKIAVGIKSITQSSDSQNLPFLYCGRTTYTTESLEPYGQSPLFSFPPSFRNALVQSIAGGNTMIFNRKTKYLLEGAGLVDIPSHDWWCYLLVTAVGGITFYDSKPQILYRQHTNASVGESQSLGSRFKRISMLFAGRFKDWNNTNIAALKPLKAGFTNENKLLFDLFTKMHSSTLRDRIRLFGVIGLYRQTRFGTLSLIAATVINLI
jgi:glycosyltransferase involved in cell wall biosynthesis